MEAQKIKTILFNRYYVHHTKYGLIPFLRFLCFPFFFCIFGRYGCFVIVVSYQNEHQPNKQKIVRKQCPVFKLFMPHCAIVSVGKPQFKQKKLRRKKFVGLTEMNVQPKIFASPMNQQIILSHRALFDFD